MSDQAEALADLSAAIRDYLTGEDVSRPSFRATELTARLAPLIAARVEAAKAEGRADLAAKVEAWMLARWTPDHIDYDDLAAALDPGAPMTAARRRLQSPTGTLMWRVRTPTGGDHICPTEQDAKNKAALHDGSVYYPLVVELEEPA